jgi:hypothetical protein
MARRAEREAILVSPFVKVGALRRVLDEIRDDVSVLLYTRWRPDEIAAGVSDVDAWEVICERPLSSMYLLHHLHAKCYVFDSEASVGSANITHSGLGWHSNSNLEIQVGVPASNERVASLLKELQSSATAVNDAIAARLDDQASVTPWLPNTRQPSDLYLAYEGRKNEISRGAQATAVLDLNFLGIPPGLPRRDFESCVAAVLAQNEVFLEIHELSRVRRRFGEYRRFVSEYLSRNASDRDPADTWQTCLRWLLHFCPDRYEIDTPKYTEILVRRQETRES